MEKEGSRERTYTSPQRKGHVGWQTTTKGSQSPRLVRKYGYDEEERDRLENEKRYSRPKSSFRKIPSPRKSSPKRKNRLRPHNVNEINDNTCHQESKWDPKEWRWPTETLEDQSDEEDYFEELVEEYLFDTEQDEENQILF